MNILQQNCIRLYNAYKEGKLGNTTMPEDAHPDFSNTSQPLKFAYFTLPMALNYQRNSYKLWEAATAVFLDTKTNYLFDIANVQDKTEDFIRSDLVKYKLALQPYKHANTWVRLAKTFYKSAGSIPKFFKLHNYDVLELKEVMQKRYKQDFPYLSGPKIFNYWLHVMERYCAVRLTNREFIEIAPDTHVIQASIRLGVLKKSEKTLDREKVSARWREVLEGTGITPIDMHSPLWFWSRGGFILNFV